MVRTSTAAGCAAVWGMCMPVGVHIYKGAVASPKCVWETKLSVWYECVHEVECVHIQLIGPKGMTV